MGCVVFGNGQRKRLCLRDLPDKCPICHKSISPNEIVQYIIEEDGHPTKARVVYECPDLKCQELFIGFYIGYLNREGMMTSWYYELNNVEPYRQHEVKFEKVIEELSSKFIEIYNQASCAEQVKLNQICGMGYRKALEFLIKDYLIQEFPDNEQDIKSLLLKPCIDKYINNEDIKNMASRAVWIGNDETHYLRKWEDKDITDLKRLIDITVYWISYTIQTRVYLREMPQGRK